jgi:hypothetical protein
MPARPELACHSGFPRYFTFAITAKHGRESDIKVCMNILDRRAS